MGRMTRREDGNIKSSFVPVKMLYITVSKREPAASPFTASPLHRIFKLQFHAIAVGVSVRGILKKRAIKTKTVREGGGKRRKRNDPHRRRP